MLRLLRLTLLAVLLLALLPAAALAVDPPAVQVNGKTLSFDVPPQVRGGRTFLPVRYIATALGAKVYWVQEEQKVIVKTEEVTAELWLDNPVARFNGQRKVLDQAPFAVDGRTMLPVRAVADMLSFVVDWDEPSRTVHLTSPAGIAPTLIAVEALTPTVRKGDLVTVEVWLRRSRAAYTAVVELEFDPAVLQARQVTPGNIIEGLTAAQRFNNRLGTVTYAVSKVGVVRGFSGDGILFSVTFEAVRDGSVWIRPDGDSMLVDSGVEQMRVVRSGIGLQVNP